MSEEKTYTEKEMISLINAAKERQETLEALECARIIMNETKQYPRFINRINYIISSIEGVSVQAPPVKPVEVEKKEPVEAPKKTK
jgi:hypothetical protein